MLLIRKSLFGLRLPSFTLYVKCKEMGLILTPIGNSQEDDGQTFSRHASSLRSMTVTRILALARRRCEKCEAPEIGSGRAPMAWQLRKFLYTLGVVQRTWITFGGFSFARAERLQVGTGK